MLQEERDRAERLHGPLTIDRFRAFAILTEEIGEVGRAILEHARRVRAAPEARHTETAASELIQVAVTALIMAEQMLEEVNGKQE